MNKSLQALNATLFDYLLVIVPYNDVYAKVVDIKEAFWLNYKCKFAANLYPHIALSEFVIYDSMEKRIVQLLEKFSKSVVPFRTILKGFGTVANHTFYVNVASKEPIIKVVKNMKLALGNHLQSNSLFKPHFSTIPNLTIARKMTKEQFEKAEKEWKNEAFDSSFEVRSMRLLKRVNDKYHIVKDIHFTGDGAFDIQPV
ncbi:2'-5' RNA ligase family protein [Solitalea lacus]|uniref:2'-5' RNA ligase family protein n=1 Tax=Solitalea lacus TaxID=2911172 RepID=UPI001EDBAED7|nr:2'-5' RNA ligase family protein [Solitalea lacus]UKJ07669.1 2'-5' RNA ligase family protein [Solitalea lacus]